MKLRVCFFRHHMGYCDIMMQIIVICTRLKLITIGVFKCCVNVVPNVATLGTLESHDMDKYNIVWHTDSSSMVCHHSALHLKNCATKHIARELTSSVMGTFLDEACRELASSCSSSTSSSFSCSGWQRLLLLTGWCVTLGGCRTWLFSSLAFSPEPPCVSCSLSE